MPSLVEVKLDTVKWPDFDAVDILPERSPCLEYAEFVVQPSHPDIPAALVQLTSFLRKLPSLPELQCTGIDERTENGQRRHRLPAGVYSAHGNDALSMLL
ncbi:hypothetical protein V5O48_018785, partial [Marasmius crinis-equi]